MVRRMPAADDPTRIFDRRLVRLRRARAAATVGRVAPVLEAAADRLLDRLDDTTRRFSRALDLGGRGMVAPRLRARGIGFVVSMDLSARMAALSGRPAVAGDEEWLPFAPESFDLVVANLSLHWVNDLPGALVQVRRCLRPDGLFLASLPGLGTLGPLREALAAVEAELRGGVSPRVSPFPELQDMAALLQRAGFALPVADAEELPLAYRTPMALLSRSARRGRDERGAGARRAGAAAGAAADGDGAVAGGGGGDQAGVAVADRDRLGAAREPVEAGTAWERYGAASGRARCRGAERGRAGRRPSVRLGPTALGR